jgi:hypothetical protein
MASYIVRFGPSEPRARELVGIFVADTVDQLFELVNETETPLCCEYRQLGSGGIYWESGTKQTAPQHDRSDEANGWFTLPNEPVLSTSWEAAISVGDHPLAPVWRAIPTPRWP